MSLDQSLVLNHYFFRLFKADGVSDLTSALAGLEEGPGRDGVSHFHNVLAERLADDAGAARLRDYDRRVMDYEARLARVRGGFAFKYFQYLAVLFTEAYLDRLTADPEDFRRELNAFLHDLQRKEAGFGEFPAFEARDLRKLAFFMATGSGKTLVMHVNLWQLHHYLAHGAHPEALVRRPDRARTFDAVILVTPNEGLSRQHIAEFQASGIEAGFLVENRSPQRTFEPRVSVIEISKLADEPSRDGVSIPMDELGGMNLVFVDEGHKGTSSEARVWKDRQKRLAASGFTLEYSATFAQAISAARQADRPALLEEYGKAILFDYSYRHFYGDGYGKDFRVLNLSRARVTQAFEVLTVGLLVFYRQLREYTEGERDLRPYNLERPLWVFLGSSVNAVFKQDGREQSDVATVVEFVRRLLEDEDWGVCTMDRILRAPDAFGEDAADRLASFAPANAARLYREVTSAMFHGRGGLELREIKGSEGEIGLRVTAPEGKENPYFGVINIGDVPAFRKHLEDMKMAVTEDRFHTSLFAEVNATHSRVNLLIGAKKFIEGWSSWRVSTMGLLNIGKGEGPQVIQLFGRGVRLKGKGWSLKRSSPVPETGPHPAGLALLETLHIFGWNADYVQRFREDIEAEDPPVETEIPLLYQHAPAKGLKLPARPKGFDPQTETWTLATGAKPVTVDLVPRLVSQMPGRKAAMADYGRRVQVDFSDADTLALIDMDGLYCDLLEHKTARTYGNVFIPRTVLPDILACNTLFMPEEEIRNLDLLQTGAGRLLRAYLDHFVSSKEQGAYLDRMEPKPLRLKESSVPYRVRGPASIIQKIEALKKQKTALHRTDRGRTLPRLHIDQHLFSPLLLAPVEGGVSISPPGLQDGERKFLEDLVDFWKTNQHQPPYRDMDVTLYRNLPHIGIDLGRNGGFFPDFILWARRRGTLHVRFVEPHGLVYGGIPGNQDKFEAISKIEGLSRSAAFQAKKMTLGAFMLTETARQKIPGAEELTWQQLEAEYRLLNQRDAGYIQRILHSCCP